MRDSLEVALGGADLEVAARGYCNVAELLYREGQLGELEACIAEGLPFARERGFWSHAYNLELHRCVLQLRRGDLDGALAGLRELVHGVEDPGMLFAYSVPWLGRALARRGDPAAGGLLAGTWDGAQRQRLLLGVAYAGLASVEWAWLAGRPEIAERVAASLAPRLAHPGAAPFRAELTRYLARAGLPAEPFDGCPEPWAAGLRGDWRAAADGWETAGDPYEQALELTESGDARTVAEGLRILDAMDAAGAAARVRATLRAAGVPAGRGPRATTRANPFGLTERQLDVLELLSEGLTNAQIAERLVLSVRTVDHHVAAVLEKLDVPSRHEAAGGGATDRRRRDYSTLSPITPGSRPALSTRVLAAAGVDGERVERALGVGDVDRRRQAGEASGGAAARDRDRIARGRCRPPPRDPPGRRRPGCRRRARG